MKIEHHLKRLYQLLKKPSKECLELSLQDVHYPSMFSLVIGGNEFGKLTRVFIAGEELLPYKVQQHSHRYPLRITTISGDIKHYVAKETKNPDASSLRFSKYEYKSFLQEGHGLKYLGDASYNINEYTLPIGTVLEMSEHEIHSMSCSKGSIWVVEEQGFKTDSSIVLGIPFVIEGLYNKASMFQINDRCQLVAKAIKKIILDYDLID